MLDDLNELDFGVCMCVCMHACVCVHMSKAIKYLSIWWLNSPSVLESRDYISPI